MSLKFQNNRGDFILHHAQLHPELYLPLANEGGLMSCVTPLLGGDCKTGQNFYLLAPASAETLHESRASRNFWVRINGAPWSATGVSAPQQAGRFDPDGEEAVLTGGLLWQNVSRTHRDSGLKADVLSFVPAGRGRVEIMQVTLTNGGSEPLELECAAAVPVYGRSADNIRDHRHVTSLLHRVKLRAHGLDVNATLTFDERGHQPGQVTYRVWAGDETGAPPVGFIPLVRDFVGGGSYDWPEAVVKPDPASWLHAGQPAGCRVGRCGEATMMALGQTAQGGEVAAAMFFPKAVLRPGERRRYQVALAVDDEPSAYLTPDGVSAAFEMTKAWWQAQCAQTFRTGDGTLDAWLCWVGIQPLLRRWFGCSFLPHHDYGRGGRGWRDLWQDSLALLLSGAEGVREDLLGYFAGVRTDGTNATIIGAKAGEFKADRNGIPRVWMDHGFWPTLTTALYVNETGDHSLLLEKQAYFSDTFPHRGEGEPRREPAAGRTGTVAEHLLLQLTAAFFDVGEHGHMRLRGADWNDGLDMAKERGESVAFTAAYAYGFDLLADMLTACGARTLEISAPLAALLDFPCGKYGQPEAMQAALADYCAAIDSSGETVTLSASELAAKLCGMAGWLRGHIARNEWVGDGADLHWFNSYYDNSGRPVEGRRGESVGMMLTGQVFTILAGVAGEERVREIVRAADRYLWHPDRGGVCLNTDFGEVKLDMGRMFGFAYGNKENGAVFCHMAVMYAYALYSRGFANQGWRVLEQLYRQSADFARGSILPGIPEYFDDRGRGMYPYLTGAGSWMLFTLQTQAFGVRGLCGDLVLEPKLTAAQFNESGTAEISCTAAGRPVHLRYENPLHLDFGGYKIGTVQCEGRIWEGGGSVRIPKAELPRTDGALELTATLIPKGGDRCV